jgi:nicotinamidase-related amidase
MTIKHPDYINIDPLAETYRESVLEPPAIIRSLEQHRTALLCIDLQYLDAAPGYGVFADAEKSGIPIEAQEYYFNRLEELVLPNVGSLQAAFRQKELEVIHTRIQSLTQDGRDR